MKNALLLLPTKSLKQANSSHLKSDQTFYQTIYLKTNNLLTIYLMRNKFSYFSLKHSIEYFRHFYLIVKDSKG